MPRRAVVVLRRGEFGLRVKQGLFRALLAIQGVYSALKLIQLDHEVFCVADAPNLRRRVAEGLRQGLRRVGWRRLVGDQWAPVVSG
jgi:hypothetical protein